MTTAVNNFHSILESILSSPILLTDPAKTAEPTVESAQTTAVLDSDERPDHSYLNLIVMALSSMPGTQGTLHDIYIYISSRFPFYTKNRKHWKNSVRHNLALHKCFQRLDTETDGASQLLKKPKTCPLWSLRWKPAERPEKPNARSRKRNPNKTAFKKRKGDKSEAAGKSSSSKKAKSTWQSVEPLTDVKPLTRISMMLPEIRSGVATASSTLHQGLVQPPHTPESDYCSLSSACSPYLPGLSLSEKCNSSSTCGSVFQYPSQVSSPPLQDIFDRRFSPLPLLSVEEICSVLRDDYTPGSPDSGTGADILDGFGWFDELATVEQHQHCLADSLLDNSYHHEVLDNFQPEPPAVSFFVPKVPVEQPLSVDTNRLFW